MADQETTWMYNALALNRNPGSDLVQQLDHVGSQGWELCALTQDGVAVFKKPVPVEETVYDLDAE